MSDLTTPVRVVAGVIRDPRGRVLLTRRTARSDFAGLWEFPGGKCQAGESARQALTRELSEELGISAHIGPWLITVPWHSQTRRIELDVWSVASWRGSPRGQEGQALAWVEPERLNRYAMPPADRPVVGALCQPAYLWQMTHWPADQQVWLAFLEQFVDLPVTWLRLPAMEHPCAHLPWMCQAVQTKPRYRQKIQLLLTGDIRQADQWHVGVHLSAQQARRLGQRPLAMECPVGMTCHHLDDLYHAQQLACDYAVFCPLTTLVPPVSAHWQSVRSRVSIPMYCPSHGEVTATATAQVRAHGFQGLAVEVDQRFTTSTTHRLAAEGVRL